jgi:hypothetical protein
MKWFGSNLENHFNSFQGFAHGTLLNSTIPVFYNQFLEWVYGQINEVIYLLPDFLRQLIEVSNDI